VVAIAVPRQERVAGCTNSILHAGRAGHPDPRWNSSRMDGDAREPQIKRFGSQLSGGVLGVESAQSGIIG